MADISIIVTLDPGAGRIDALASSLAGQTSDGFELVCVGGDADVDGFGAVAGEQGLSCRTVTCGGDAAAMREAGLGASTRGYVLFANSFTRFAKGLVEILSAELGEFGSEGVDVYAFHMQAIDTASSRYLTKDYAMRRQTQVLFEPAERGEQLFQRYGANLCGMLISREHLLSLGQGFSCENPIDDEPVAMLSLCRAGKAVYVKWPMTAIAYDRSSFIESMVSSQLERRLDIAAGMSRFFFGPAGDAASASSADGAFQRRDSCLREPSMEPFVRSYLEWLVGFAVDGLDEQPSGMQERLIDAIGEKVTPVVRSLGEDGMHLGDWEKLRTVELCGLDRMSLIEAGIALERDALERVYDSEVEGLRADRDRRSGAGDGRRRRRLFSRR